MCGTYLRNTFAVSEIAPRRVPLAPPSSQGDSACTDVLRILRRGRVRSQRPCECLSRAPPSARPSGPSVRPLPCRMGARYVTASAGRRKPQTRTQTSPRTSPSLGWSLTRPNLLPSELPRHRGQLLRHGRRGQRAKRPMVLHPLAQAGSEKLMVELDSEIKRMRKE